MSVDEQEEKLNIHMSQMLRKIELGAICAIILLCDSACVSSHQKDMPDETAIGITNLLKKDLNNAH